METEQLQKFAPMAGAAAISFLIAGYFLLPKAAAPIEQASGEAVTTLAGEEATPPTASDGAASSISSETAALARKAEAQGEWLLYGRTFNDQRFSPLDKVNDKSVKGLGLAWVADVPSADGLAATPIVDDGVIYLSGAFANVFAYDAASGKVLWHFDPKIRLDMGFSNSWSGRINRGVAKWADKIYVGAGDCRLFAIDAASGEEVWEATTCDPLVGYGITGAPRVANGKVFIGNLGSDTATRGYVSAYNAETGALEWRFYTTPGDPKKGFENAAMEMAAKTWTGQGWWNGAGGNVWNAIAYDPELNQLYLGTAASEPKDPSERSPDGGDNLFTNSIVALDADTGEYKWHYQTVPRDAWDYNATADMIQADLMVDGEVKKVLMQAPKNGFFYVLERKTGKLLSAAKYATVTWADGIDMTTGRPIENEGARYYDSPSGVAFVYPSSQGAHNWQPMSFSPDTGLAYIPVQDFPALFIKGVPNSNWGAYPYDPSDKELMKGVGRLVAWDPVRQAARWIAPHDLPINGGTLTTHGNLVFQGTATGEVRAYSADKGELLWSAKTGASVQAAPVTYSIGAEQYILVPAGVSGQARLVFPEYGASEDGRGPSRLFAYKLGGTAKAPVDLPFTEPPVPAPPAQDADIETIRKGEKLFMTIGCLGCHGAAAIQDTRGAVPDLRYLTPEKHEYWDMIVREGAFSANGMPNHGAFLSEEDAHAIHAYIIDLQQKLYAEKNKAEATSPQQ